MLILIITETALVQCMLEIMGGGEYRSGQEITGLDENFTTGESVAVVSLIKLIPVYIVQLIIGLWLYLEARSKLLVMAVCWNTHKVLGYSSLPVNTND